MLKTRFKVDQIVIDPIHHDYHGIVYAETIIKITNNKITTKLIDDRVTSHYYNLNGTMFYSVYTGYIILYNNLYKYLYC